MKKNKIFFVVFGLIGVLLFGLVALLPVQAATSGNFTITITVAYISINLQDWTRVPSSYTTWAAGSKNAGDLATMEANSGLNASEKGVLVSNESASLINLLCYATNTKNWALDGYAPAYNTCVLEVSTYDGWQAPTYPDMASPLAITATSSPGITINSGLDRVSKWWYFRIQTPTSLSDPTENTFTVTVEAVVP